MAKYSYAALDPNSLKLENRYLELAFTHGRKKVALGKGQ